MGNDLMIHFLVVTIVVMIIYIFLRVLEYFLPDNEYDSDDFNFLGYDLVEKLDEINMEQNEVIINEKMRKNNDAIVDDKKDDIIIEGEDGVIVEDDVIIEDIEDVEDVEDVEDNIIVDDININKENINKEKTDKNLTMHGELSNYKTTLSIRSKTCENFITRESSICNECNKLRKNSHLNQATKKQRATGKNIRFIPKWYLEHPLSKLLLIADCKIDLNLKVDLIKVNIHETWWKADGVKEKPEIFCFASHHNGHPALQQRKPHLYSLDWLCPQCNSTPEDLNHLWTCLYVLPDLNPCSTYHNEIVKF
ncbi:hypothetical protein RhiirA1_475019 [Rhizophagus irregularis]|uniref:Uncharacterized protein n=1 Tax=Rhizophagus irregularis TaxID=588596 RepID=A0A2N0QXI9_9GLOM|nr:hypothetical protein RhiirA1_475019 [Rhizophagus irregularis]